MKAKFSYSRLNQYINCPWAYKLKYEDKHFIDQPSIAIDLGTLVHHIEEQIGNNIINGEEIDYENLKDQFQHVNIPKSSPFDQNGGIYGLDVLKQKYPTPYFERDAHGSCYAVKCANYLNEGIYRLENFAKANPDLELVAVEKYFEFTFAGTVFKGYIDRLWKYKNENKYLIEDIKTRDRPFDEKDTKTPLQLVVYALSIYNMLQVDVDETMISFNYDLPFCNMRQSAGTKGWLKRGMSKIEKSLGNIESQDWEPNPSPLCYWCPFSATNPNQPEEGKRLCPYHSLWTRQNSTYECLNKWEGIENHEKVMEHYLATQATTSYAPKKFKFDF